MGEVQLLVYWPKGEGWDPEIEALRGTRIGDQIPVIEENTLNLALHGLSKPLVNALGIPPFGALLKLPKAATVCSQRKRCPMFDETQCFPTTKRKLPWCFEPDLKDEPRVAAAKVIAEWRQGVYVVAIKEPVDG